MTILKNSGYIGRQRDRWVIKWRDMDREMDK